MEVEILAQAIKPYFLKARDEPIKIWNDFVFSPPFYQEISPAIVLRMTWPTELQRNYLMIFI